MGQAYRRAPTGSGRRSPPPVVAAVQALCNRVCVDQEGPEANFSATGTVTGERVTVRVSGEVDMSTADAMFRAVTRDHATAATVDLTAVTFFDSAAIQALVRLAEHYPGALEVIPSAQVLRVLDISGLAGQPWLKHPA
jgi:anti-anti-sigma factor